MSQTPEHTNHGQPDGLDRLLSEFFKGHLGQITDLRPTEILTLVPLGGLVVVFGLLPGLVLTLVYERDASGSGAQALAHGAEQIDQPHRLISGSR